MKYRTYRKRVSRYVRLGRLEEKRRRHRQYGRLSRREDEVFEKAQEAYSHATEFMWTHPLWYGRLKRR